jgi:hypothetical protein
LRVNVAVPDVNDEVPNPIVAVVSAIVAVPDRNVPVLNPNDAVPDVKFDVPNPIVDVPDVNDGVRNRNDG